MRQDIEFDAEGTTLRGWLYVPENASGPAPAVVMCHGYSAVKELFLDAFAEVFCEAGFCALVRAGRIEPRAYRQNETFEAALQFARTEGIIPAPEPAHAIRAVIEEASDGEEKTILFGLCGHGHFDLAAYDAYFAGKLEDPEFSEADLEAALARLPQAPAIA